ncbi:MAG: dihydropyrimidinase [Candidatus Melainabacteria bacterium GWF2_37_15]|nr:MAG: dihydropyrimidinase [Candidatus Melainabacteria bacterium GWF2_37_15]
MDILIKNGFVATSKETKIADILIKNGKIHTVGENITDEAAKIIDATNMLVMPGGVDVHTHLDMPFMGTTTSDDFESGTIAAAFGGTTSIVDYVMPKKGESLKKAIDKWQKKAAGKAVIDYGFHVSIVPPVHKTIKELESLAEAGITSVKYFLAYKDALMLDDASLYNLLEEARKHKILVCVHAENGEIIDFLTKRFLKEKKTAPIYHAYSRPPELEGEAVSRVIKLADMTKTPVYFVHLSTKDSMREIKLAKKDKQAVFAETCPQYMLLSENKYFEKSFLGAKYIMSPPLRRFKHCDYLKKSLLNDHIDVIATDHCSFNFNKQKQRGMRNFTQIPNGIPGIETRMPLMYNEMVVKMGMSVSKFVEINCTRPAKMFGLKQKGDIKPGKDADIAIWNPDLIWKIKKSKLHERVDYTPFEDMAITGKPVIVLSRGEIIVENNELKVNAGHGQYIKREISTLAY